jgi:hypothetical protein
MADNGKNMTKNHKNKIKKYKITNQELMDNYPINSWKITLNLLILEILKIQYNHLKNN